MRASRPAGLGLLLFLGACSPGPRPLPLDGTGTHGGDPVGLLLEGARPRAEARVRKVRPEKLDPRLGAEMISWFTLHQKDLADEIAALDLGPASSSQTQCASTDPKLGARVFVAYSQCRTLVHTPEQAEGVVIHEAIHHIAELEDPKGPRLALDEKFANALSNALMAIPLTSLDGRWRKFTAPYVDGESLQTNVESSYALWNEKLVVIGLGRLWLFDPKLLSWKASPYSSALEGRSGAAIAASNDTVLVWGGRVEEEKLDAQKTRALRPGKEVDDFGYFKDTVAYHPSEDRLELIKTRGAPSPRRDADLFWTGKEFLLWSGERTDESHPYKSFESWPGGGWKISPDGASWQRIAEPGPDLLGARAMWTGSSPVAGFDRKLLFCYFTHDARLELSLYDPDSDQWSSRVSSTTTSIRTYSGYPVWIGKALMWVNPLGEFDFDNGSSSWGSIWWPEKDRWTTITDAGAPASRRGASTTWNGAYLLAHGGYETAERQTVGDGGIYHPELDQWWPMAEAGAPRARLGSLAVWVGESLVIVGGLNERDEPISSGAVYYP